MSTTTQISGLPIPDDDSPNDPPIHFQAFADVIEKRLVNVYASTTVRDTAITTPSDGMVVYIEADDTFYERISGAWVKRVAALGLVAYAELGSVASNNSTAEARLAGAHNISPVTLVAGRAYEAVARGLANIDGGAGLIDINLRAARGGTPSISSPLVATDRVYCAGTGGGGQVSYNTSGQPFQVGTSATNWQIHLFGDVISGGTGMDVEVDARQVHSIAVYDLGIAPATTRLI